MAQETGNGTASTERKELRLAIVCYGGVSLCVYMHGTTKEIHRLVKASRLLAAGDDAANGGDASPSEGVYHDLLEQETGPDGVRTEVVVDVIAGTSAGGINGIFLGKALAHNLSQDLLRELWFDKGDIKKLLRWPAWIPIWAKAPFLLARGIWKAPLRGKDMSVWLHDALRGMDESGQSPPELNSLMPDGHPLQLFVTMTDFYGYDRQVPITSPPIAHDRRHRHVFEFKHDDGTDSFGSEDNVALAFAARTTSCFPGAFPPVSISTFENYLPGVKDDPALAEYFRLYTLSGGDARLTYFVDGGVLDNRPFGHVLTAIRRKPAEVQVDRRLLYLEPDPGGAAPAAPGREPKTIEAVLGAVSGIPRREPILDDLLGVADLNEQVRRVQDIVTLSFERVAEKTNAILEQALAAGAPPDAATVRRWQTELNEQARKDAGTAYTTYVRSKISDAVDRVAKTACDICDFPDDSNHAYLVRGVCRCWAEQAGLFEHAPEPTEAQVQFLRAFDLDYGIRRLQFALAGVNGWYAHLGKSGIPARAELDAVKARLWQAVGDLREVMSGSRFTPGLSEGISACFPQEEVGKFLGRPEQYLEERQEKFNQVQADLRAFYEAESKRFSAELFADMERLTDSWDWDTRKLLLARFLGFPFWDILLFPIQSISGAGERDAVEVIRMSPRDTDLLEVRGRKEKLDGIGLGHFRAFFKRQYRENDYLWGRLDAAERMIGLVLGKEHARYRTWCAKAFLAILEEEGDALSLVKPLVGDLHGQAEQLLQAAPAPAEVTQA